MSLRPPKDVVVEVVVVVEVSCTRSQSVCYVSRPAEFTDISTVHDILESYCIVTCTKRRSSNQVALSLSRFFQFTAQYAPGEGIERL